MQNIQNMNGNNIMEAWLASCALPTVTQRGAIIEGTVVRLDSKLGAWVDFGSKSDALVPTSEQDEPLTEGQKTFFFVLDVPANEEDVPTFSSKRAQPWIAMQNALASGAVQTARVLKVRRNKSQGIAGVSVRCGELFGFVPYSLLGVRGKAVDELVNSDIPVKAIQVDPAERKLVFDHKSAAVSSFVSSLNVGDVRTGTVTRVVAFGCFVDLGNGIQGLLHNSQLSSAYRGDMRADGSRGEARKTLSPGATLNVRVHELDAAQGRIKLSLKGVAQGRSGNPASEQA